MSRRVLKWTVPVDDQWHQVGSGRVVLVDCQTRPHEVQVWTEEPVDSPESLWRRHVRVFGTGHELPPFGEHLGSVMAAGGALVWHLYSDGGSTSDEIVDWAEGEKH